MYRGRRCSDFTFVNRIINRTNASKAGGPFWSRWILRKPMIKCLFVHSLSVRGINQRHRMWKMWNDNNMSDQVINKTSQDDVRWSKTMPKVCPLHVTGPSGCVSLFAFKNLTSKPRQVLFFFRKSFAGILRNFCGRILLILKGLSTFVWDNWNYLRKNK